MSLFTTPQSATSPTLSNTVSLNSTDSLPLTPHLINRARPISEYIAIDAKGDDSAAKSRPRSINSLEHSPLSRDAPSVSQPPSPRTHPTPLRRNSSAASRANSLRRKPVPAYLPMPDGVEGGSSGRTPAPESTSHVSLPPTHPFAQPHWGVAGAALASQLGWSKGSNGSASGRSSPSTPGTGEDYVNGLDISRPRSTALSPPPPRRTPSRPLDAAKPASSPSSSSTPLSSIAAGTAVPKNRWERPDTMETMGFGAEKQEELDSRRPSAATLKGLAINGISDRPSTSAGTLEPPSIPLSKSTSNIGSVASASEYESWYSATGGGESVNSHALTAREHSGPQNGNDGEASDEEDPEEMQQRLAALRTKMRSPLPALPLEATNPSTASLHIIPREMLASVRPDERKRLEGLRTESGSLRTLKDGQPADENAEDGRRTPQLSRGTTVSSPETTETHGPVTPRSARGSNRGPAQPEVGDRTSSLVSSESSPVLESPSVTRGAGEYYEDVVARARNPTGKGPRFGRDVDLLRATRKKQKERGALSETAPLRAGAGEGEDSTSNRKKKKETFSVDRLPTRKTMYEAGSFHLRDEDGELVCFGDLFPPADPASASASASASEASEDRNSVETARPPIRKTVVFFIRHFYCGQCQDYTFASLALLDAEAIRAAGIRVVVISNGSWRHIKPYKRLLGCPFDIYVDGPRKLYHLLGMTKMTNDFGPWFKGRAAYHQRSVPTQLLHGFAQSLKHLALADPGKLTQLGGEFIFLPGYECEFAHRMTNTSNHMEAPDVMRLAGVENPTKSERQQVQLAEEQRVELQRLQGEMKGWKEERQGELERIRQRKAERRGEGYVRRGSEPFDPDTEEQSADGSSLGMGQALDMGPKRTHDTYYSDQSEESHGGGRNGEAGEDLDDEEELDLGPEGEEYPTGALEEHETLGEVALGNEEIRERYKRIMGHSATQEVRKEEHEAAADVGDLGADKAELPAKGHGNLDVTVS